MQVAYDRVRGRKPSEPSDPALIEDNAGKMRAELKKKRGPMKLDCPHHDY